MRIRRQLPHRLLAPTAVLVLAGLAACGGRAVNMDGMEFEDEAPRFPSEPPPPMPVEDVVFPDFHERVLTNGARLIVVENAEQPVVTVQLVMPGGSARDPAGMPGLASVTASQIDKGTKTMSARELAEEIDFLGARLGAGASSEWTSVSLTALTDFLDRGLELMSDVVRNPVFPEDELATEKQRRVSNLRLQASQPASLAQKAFLEGVYGEHPYGQVATVESIESIETGALADYHARYYRPGEALFVVAGDVNPDAIAGELERAFAGWAVAPPPEDMRAAPPERADRRMVFVHKPGSVQAVIRIGHLFPSADEADWAALDVANQVLGSGSAQFNAWMMEVLREEKGYTYGANSSMAERRGPGYFVMNGEFRNEVADSSLTIMLDLAERLRRGDIPPEDLEDAKLYLTGSFPLGIETPQQVAGQVASNRLLGRPDRYLTEYRSLLAGIDVEDVAEVASQYIRPDRMLMVVVGDASEVLERVRPFADEVEVVDADGEPVDVEGIMAQAAAAESQTFDVSRLRPREMTYAVMFQGTEVATLVTRWVREGDAFAVIEETSQGPQTMRKTTEFDALTFAPIRTNTSLGSMGEFGFEIEGGRAVGQSFDMQSGPQPLDIEVNPGTALEGQFDIALAAMDFEDAGEMTIRLLTSAGTIEPLTASVAGQETVEVPAGTFETYRLELSGEQPMTVWVTRSDPHIVVKRELVGQPVSIVLTSQ